MRGRPARVKLVPPDTETASARRIAGVAFVLVAVGLLGLLLFAWSASTRASNATSRANKLSAEILTNRARIEDNNARIAQLETTLRENRIPIPVAPPPTSTTTTTTTTRRSPSTTRSSPSTTSTTQPPPTTSTTQPPPPRNCLLGVVCTGG